MTISPTTTFTSQPLQANTKPNLFSNIKESFRSFLGETIWRNLGKLQLSQEKMASLKKDKENFISNENAKGLTIIINDAHGNQTHQLDGISINPDVTPAGSKKYTVVFFGLKDCYEKHLDAMKKLATDTGTTVVSINFRGTLDSTGTPNGIQDYIADGKTLVNYLIRHEEADPANILIYGHSLGGGVAAKVHQELGHSGPIISESSFSNFKKTIRDRRGAFTAWIIKLAGWNINSAKALKDVQSGQLGLLVNRRDFIINYKKSSLYKALKKQAPDKEFHVIKIGKKPTQESFAPAVKIKTTNNFKNSSTPSATEAQDSSFSAIEKNIKKAEWTTFLRHPHQMIMDLTPQDSISMPDKIQNEIDRCPSKEALANQLLDLNRKYAKEDQLAYEGMVDMIKMMLNMS